MLKYMAYGWKSAGSCESFSNEVISKRQRRLLPVLLKVRPRTGKFHFFLALSTKGIIDQPRTKRRGNKISAFNGMNVKECVVIFKPPDTNSFIPPITLK